MRSVYPVFFTKAKKCVLVEAPDLEILTEGKDMSDAIEMARDAIELNCVSREGATVISFVDIDSGEYRRKIDTKTVRRNVALPSWLNYEAEHAGINVSRVLQEALMKVLNLEHRR